LLALTKIQPNFIVVATNRKTEALSNKGATQPPAEINLHNIEIMLLQKNITESVNRVRKT